MENKIYNCVPQPVIKMDGTLIIAKIIISYTIVNKKKAKKNKSINRVLEYLAISKLREIVSKVNSIDNDNIEKNLKYSMFKESEEYGCKIDNIKVEFINRDEFFYKKEDEIEIIEEENSNENIFKFNVSKAVYGGKRRRNKLKYKTDFNTEIEIQNDKITCNVKREYQDFTFSKITNHDKKYNSATEGEHEIYINDIVSIKYKIGYALAKDVLSISTLICQILLVLSFLFTLIGNFGLAGNGLIQSLCFTTLFIDILIGITLITSITFKGLEIKYRKDFKIDKLFIPIEAIYFKNIGNNEKRNIDKIVEKLKNQNNDIKYNKDRTKIILISIILACITISIISPIISYKNYVENNDFHYNIENELLYSKPEFYKGKLKGTVNENGKVKNVYELSNKEKLVIDDEITNKNYGQTFNICIIKYYKNNTDDLFETKYLVDKDMNYDSIWLDGYNYIYDFTANKTYKLNLINKKVANYEMTVYYKQSNNSNTLYNFIKYVDEGDEFNITEDFDCTDMIRKKYDKIEKVHNYESEYGKCFIIKAFNSTQKVDYLLYIENKNKIDNKELDGILLNSCIDKNGLFNSDESAIKSFEMILSENKSNT